MHALELKVPPLLVMVIVGALMWLGSRIAPALAFPMPAHRVVVATLTLLGLATAVAGVISFRLARTTVNPLKPESASALVASGIYRVTRNPMYLGAVVVLLAWAAHLSNALAFLLVPSFVLYMNRFQIAPEERALAARFGPAFAAYRARVRRWL